MALFGNIWNELGDDLRRAVPSKAKEKTKLPFGGLIPLVIFLLFWIMPDCASSDVLTQHNDISRSGAQLQEITLNPANVTPSTFGRLYTRYVNGQIIAQPLYVSNVLIPNIGRRNIVYVATRANMIYAFDADNTDPNPANGLLWSAPVLLTPAAPVPNMCTETVGPVGITSTPVIDPVSGTMYVVARRSDGTIWLFALDIATGGTKVGTPGAVQITASYGGLNFSQGLELNRAGLLLWNGAVVLGFSALNCDNPGWHGWVLAYRASDLAQVGVFATTSTNGYGGGVWASGKGIAADGNGNIFFETGNGSVSGTTDLGQSFVKLALGPPPNYGLSLAGKYTVSNWPELDAGDTDLGASGPMLLPGGRLAGGGKQGKVYVLSTQTMQLTQNQAGSGGVPPGGSDGFQAFINTWHNDPSQPQCMAGVITQTLCYMPQSRYGEYELYGPNIHTGLIYWNGRIYSMPEKDFIRAYPYDPVSGVMGTTPLAVSTVRAPDGMPGGALSLSANGASNGIVWASIPKYDGQWVNVPGFFAAFDAITLQKLWSDDDDIAFAKFNPPTIAGGKVFRPTFANMLIVYGLTTPTPTPCYTIGQLYQNYTGAEGLLGGATTSIAPSPDGKGQFQNYGGGAIYWTAATCAHEVHSAIYAEWAAVGMPGFLGYPLTNETVAADGIGHFNHFQNGSIYWTPTAGAHEVHGAIRGAWQAWGSERSVFGYPVSDESDEVDGSGRFSLFEHGAIHWNSATGAITMSPFNGLMLGPPEAGTDHPGNDIIHISLPEANPAMCEERCASNSSCLAWTYVAPNTIQGSLPMCWLKGGSVPLPVANAACTSGLKIATQPVGFTLMNGAVDRPGGDFANFILPDTDPRLCQGECAANASCNAWAYNAGRCWLKNIVPAQVANECCTSGARSQ